MVKEKSFTAFFMHATCQPRTVGDDAHIVPSAAYYDWRVFARAFLVGTFHVGESQHIASATADISREHKRTYRVGDSRHIARATASISHETGARYVLAGLYPLCILHYALCIASACGRDGGVRSATKVPKTWGDSDFPLPPLETALQGRAAVVRRTRR